MRFETPGSENIKYDDKGQPRIYSEIEQGIETLSQILRKKIIC